MSYLTVSKVPIEFIDTKVTQLVQHCYEEASLGHSYRSILGIISDALEENGYEGFEISHLRNCDCKLTCWVVFQIYWLILRNKKRKK